METIKEALTFDDVLILPKYSNDFTIANKYLFKINKKIILKVPFYRQQWIL